MELSDLCASESPGWFVITQIDGYHPPRFLIQKIWDEAQEFFMSKFPDAVGLGSTLGELILSVKQLTFKKTKTILLW